MLYRRARLPGACYFFTLNLNDRNKTLLVDHIKELRQAFRSVKSNHPFHVEGVVVLPNHLHLLLRLPEGDLNYSQRLNLIKGNFSRSIGFLETISPSRQRKRERGIWQRRFWEHLVRNEKDYENHLNYIHYNPVKHGYVRKPIDWPHSSIHQYVERGVMAPRWGADIKEFGSGYGE